MSQPAELFRQLHYLHLKVRDLREEAESGPNRLRRFKIKIEEQDKQLHAWQDKLKHVRVDIHARETSIKENLTKVEKFQSQMGQVTTKKEYDALRHEIDNHRQMNRVIEDKILELMLELDELSKQTPELERLVKHAKEECSRAEVELSGKVQELQARLNESELELKNAEASLPPDIKLVYDRLFKAHGADSLCAVQGRSCAGCYTEVTPQAYNDVRSGRMVLCKNCGKLLYMGE
jgi:hypothetical protein